MAETVKAVDVRGMALRGTDIVLWFQNPAYPYAMGSICHTYGKPLHVPEHWSGWELARIDFGETVEIRRTLDKVRREIALPTEPEVAASVEGQG